MKKLKELSINPEKVMKNNEMVNLRGGVELPCVWFDCQCTSGFNSGDAWTDCYDEIVDITNVVSGACGSQSNGYCERIFG